MKLGAIKEENNVSPSFQAIKSHSKNQHLLGKLGIFIFRLLQIIVTGVV